MPKIGIDLVYLAMEGSADYLVADEMNYKMKLVPQLGFQYLSGTLRSTGRPCRIFDQPVLRFGQQKLFSDLAANPDRAVGFYCDSFLKPKVIDWIRALRQAGSDKSILVGGPGAFGAEDYLKAGADIVAHGEGERTIIEIAEVLEGTRERDALRGVSYRHDNEIIHTDLQNPITDLDHIPLPDRDQYPISLYRDFHMFPMRIPFASMLASRGCPNQCTFCSSPAIWGRQVRVRTPENVAAEIDHLITRYGVRFVGFKDDVFPIKPGWLDAFHDEMMRRKSPVRFSCNIHPYSYRRRRAESMKMLAEAGCRLIVAGLQSVDPTVLQNIRRHKDEPEELMETVRVAKKQGIAIVAEFIFGLPGDNRTSWQGAVDWAKKARPHYALYYSLSKLEGSDIERQYRDRAVTEFSEAEIRDACAKAQRTFFTNPRTILRDIWFVLRRNPSWLVHIARNLPYLVNSLGIKLRRGQGQKVVEQ